MAKVLVLGAGMTGLTTAALLARAGHQVSVLERDPQPPPTEAAQICVDWDRPGVAQFHQLHVTLPRWTSVISAELPELICALDALGGRRINLLHQSPERFTSGWWPGDEQFDTWTARRPVLEAALALVAGRIKGLAIRRGVHVSGLVIDDGGAVPHIRGVRTESGETIVGDLTVDATGRRSPVGRWLGSAGHPALPTRATESGSIYYARHFRADSDRLPRTGSLLMHYPSMSTLTLPADNRTWAVAVVVHHADRAMRALHDTAAWESVVGRTAAAPWLAAEPLDRVRAFAGHEDRISDIVVDGRPVVTGLVPVGDSWARTNPGLGRGMTVGALHAVTLRNVLHDVEPSAAETFTSTFAEHTDAALRPLVEATIDFGRNRLTDMWAEAEDEPYPDLGPAWRMACALATGARSDPMLLRRLAALSGLVATPQQVFADCDVLRRVEPHVGGRRYPEGAPSRAEIVDLLSNSRLVGST